MGPASSAAAHAAGFTPDVVAPEAEIEALVGALRAHLLTKVTDS
jgi:uroporphyrinogen-III synthase